MFFSFFCQLIFICHSYFPSIYQTYKGVTLINFRFNLIRFSGDCEKWRQRLEPATQENCHSAVSWSSRFTASGNTCTLEALRVRLVVTIILIVYKVSMVFDKRSWHLKNVQGSASCQIALDQSTIHVGYLLYMYFRKLLNVTLFFHLLISDGI